ncbi:MAG: hypothetical protein ACKPEO_07095 [Sphaerospermopsis kisseleviana]
MGKLLPSHQSPVPSHQSPITNPQSPISKKSIFCYNAYRQGRLRTR